MEGERIARLGLRVNPHDAGLLNNLTFSLVEQGKPAEAKEVIRAIPLQHAPEQAKTCVLATQGLIEYRLGKPAKGKALYQEALSKATKLKLPPLKARALLYLSREEAFAGDPTFEATLKDALREISKLNNPELQHLAAIVKNSIQNHLVQTAMQEPHAKAAG